MLGTERGRASLMSVKRASLAVGLFLGTIVFIASCSTSRSAEGPDLDPNKRLATLSNEERETWCLWVEDWLVRHYEPESSTQPLCPDGSGLIGTTTDCVAAIDRIAAECSRTVGAQTECYQEELTGECPATFPIHEGSPCRWPDDCGIPYPDD
jgi:hypothetical protein